MSPAARFEESLELRHRLFDRYPAGHGLEFFREVGRRRPASAASPEPAGSPGSSRNGAVHEDQDVELILQIPRVEALRKPVVG